jgi:hypothetical protein
MKVRKNLFLFSMEGSYIVFPLQENAHTVKDYPPGYVVITRRRSMPAPKQEISIPDTRLINPRFFPLMRVRTVPTDPQRITHQATDPKNTPETNSTAERTEFP